MTPKQQDDLAAAEARAKSLTEQVREYEILCDLVRDEIDLLTKHLALSADIPALAAHEGKTQQYRDLRLCLEQLKSERAVAFSDLARLQEFLGVHLQMTG